MFDRFHPRYLLPNSVMAASLVITVIAIVEAAHGMYETAAWLIVWSALLDRVDGVVARSLGASSEFGIQFDTLADLLAFCVAPGLLVYLLLTGDPRYAPMFASATMRGILSLSVAVYVLSGAARLARFNIQAETIGSKWFRGPPVTIAGALAATFILAAWELALPAWVIAGSPMLLIVCSVFMLSTLWLPKSFGERRRIPSVLFAMSAVAIYGIGFGRSLPVVLLAGAIAYPSLGFIFGAAHRSQS
jgi:CDP-diacylglycerol---serine O-phosphatidyltransferase